MRVTLSGCSVEKSAQKSATAFWGGGGGFPLAGVPLGGAVESLIIGKGVMTSLLSRSGRRRADLKSISTEVLGQPDLIAAQELPESCDWSCWRRSTRKCLLTA